MIELLSADIVVNNGGNRIKESKSLHSFLSIDVDMTDRGRVTIKDVNNGIVNRIIACR